MKLQSEVAELRSEITRIGSGTDFNGKKLLNGSLTISLQIGDTADSFNQLGVSISSIVTAVAITGIAVASAQTAAAAITTFKTSNQCYF